MNKALSLILLMLYLTSCHPSEQKEIDRVCNKDEIQSPKLISVEDAKQHLLNPIVLFVQVSKQKGFEEGHIPNAIQLWRSDFRSKKEEKYAGLMSSKIELENLLAEMGVQDSTMLLIYDLKGSCDALRFAWVLDFYGFNHYKVINGGLESWKRAAYEIEKGSGSETIRSEYKLDAIIDSTIFASLEDVQKAILDTQTLIIDTREPYEFLGQPFKIGKQVFNYKNGAFVSGNIPTAIHINWSDFCDLSGDHRIKCKKDILHTLKAKGVHPNKDIIVYCQSGSRSSHTAFVLKEIIGIRNVKNYDGSWIEWSYFYDKDRSVDIEQKTSEADFNKLFKVLNQEILENNG